MTTGTGKLRLDANWKTLQSFSDHQRNTLIQSLKPATIVTTKGPRGRDWLISSLTNCGSLTPITHLANAVLSILTHRIDVGERAPTNRDL